MPIGRVYGGRMNFHQYLVVSRRRFFNLLKLKNFRRSVFGKHKCLHGHEDPPNSIELNAMLLALTFWVRPGPCIPDNEHSGGKFYSGDKQVIKGWITAKNCQSHKGGKHYACDDVRPAIYSIFQ